MRNPARMLHTRRWGRAAVLFTAKLTSFSGTHPLVLCGDASGGQMSRQLRPRTRAAAVRAVVGSGATGGPVASMASFAHSGAAMSSRLSRRVRRSAATAIKLEYEPPIPRLHRGAASIAGPGPGTGTVVKQEGDTPAGAPTAGVRCVKSETRTASPRKRPRPPVAAIKPEPRSLAARGDSGKLSQPPNWEVIYENVREMRKERNAAVDSMGAEVLADSSQTPAVRRYQTLVSLMLSSQTKVRTACRTVKFHMFCQRDTPCDVTQDEVTAAAMKRLQEHGLTPEVRLLCVGVGVPLQADFGRMELQNIDKTSQDDVGQLIYPVGFWRRKALYIKETTARLVAERGGDIPDTIKGLVALKGVGPKMAHLAMTIAWNKLVHVHASYSNLY